MNNAKEAIAKALIANAAQQQAQPNPLIFNQQLEQQAAPLSTPTNPLVQSLMQRLGLLSLIRNRRNVNIIDPEASL